MEATPIIIDVAIGLIGGLSLLMIKWLREDIKDSKAELKQDSKDLKAYLEIQFAKISTQLEHHTERFSKIEVALGKLETRVDERTLKVIHVARKDNEIQEKSV